MLQLARNSHLAMSALPHTTLFRAWLKRLAATARSWWIQGAIAAIVAGYALLRLQILHDSNMADVPLLYLLFIQLLNAGITLVYGWRIGVSLVLGLFLFHVSIIVLTDNLSPYPWSTRIIVNLSFAAINLIVAYIGHLNRRLAAALQQNQLHLQKMHQQCIRLQQLVQYDSLTQLYSRGYFYECIERLFATMQRERATLGIVLLDLDRFKQINDTYGHAGGDRVLETVGSCLMAQLEPQAIAGRLGGEEFAVVQRTDTLRAAIAIAERLRQAIAELWGDANGGERSQP